MLIELENIAFRLLTVLQRSFINDNEAVFDPQDPRTCKTFWTCSVRELQVFLVEAELSHSKNISVPRGSDSAQQQTARQSPRQKNSAVPILQPSRETKVKVIILISVSHHHHHHLSLSRHPPRRCLHLRSAPVPVLPEQALERREVRRGSRGR